MEESIEYLVRSPVGIVLGKSALSSEPPKLHTSHKVATDKCGRTPIVAPKISNLKSMSASLAVRGRIAAAE